MHQQYATAACRAKRLSVSCPGRGAALFALLRSAGTHDRAKLVDPGPAAHYAASQSASKTRVKRADGIAQHPGNVLLRFYPPRIGGISTCSLRQARRSI